MIDRLVNGRVASTVKAIASAVVLFATLSLPLHADPVPSVIVGATVVAPSYGSGLQFFSSPYDYSGVALDTLFGFTGVKLAVWDPIHQLYDLTPNTPADKIRLGVGYWARFPQAVTLTSIGTPASTSSSFAITLESGWNMVGDPFLTSIPVSNLLFNSGTETFQQATTGTPLIGSVVWAYDPTKNSYVAASSLDPGRGYWIFAFLGNSMLVPHP